MLTLSSRRKLPQIFYFNMLGGRYFACEPDESLCSTPAYPRVRLVHPGKLVCRLLNRKNLSRILLHPSITFPERKSFLGCC